GGWRYFRARSAAPSLADLHGLVSRDRWLDSPDVGELDRPHCRGRLKLFRAASRRAPLELSPDREVIGIKQAGLLGLALEDATSKPRFGPPISIEQEVGAIAYWQGGYCQSRADKSGVSLLDYIHAIFGLSRQKQAQTALIIGC